MNRIALLGPGTFSNEAVESLFGGTVQQYMNYKLISEVFQSTVNGKTDYSVVPIENTIEGSVSLHLDWLVHEVDIPIQAEWVQPIQMNLIGYPSAGDEAAAEPFTHLRKIYSHGVAASQCRSFLRSIPRAEYEVVSSTAEGVRLVKQLDNPEIAAIGTLAAANLYDVPVLKRNVQDHDNNVTKFVLVGENPISLRHPFVMKTTILITLPEDYPGALHQVLSAFAWRRINLSKIESRPTKKQLGNYNFFIDIEESLDSVLVPNAIQEIEAIGCQVRILGCYPSYLIEHKHPEV